MKTTELKTPRLLLRPLTDDALAALMASVQPRDAELAAAYGDMLRGSRAHPEARIWYTAWGVWLHGNTQMIGDLCFKGPSEHPEIGYGFLDAYQNRGYATEAAVALCAWALAQPNVTAVEAETDPGNTASQRVLQKLGFVPTGETGEEGPRFILRKI